MKRVTGKHPLSVVATDGRIYRVDPRSVAEVEAWQEALFAVPVGGFLRPCRGGEYWAE